MPGPLSRGLHASLLLQGPVGRGPGTGNSDEPEAEGERLGVAEVEYHYYVSEKKHKTEWV